MSDGQKSLTLDKFLFCYQPLPTLSTKGTYYIKCREEKYRLVTEIPSSNRRWKERYFFVGGADWVCRLEEVGKVKSIDCTWGLMSKSGESSVTRLSDLVTTHFDFFFPNC